MDNIKTIFRTFFMTGLFIGAVVGIHNSILVEGTQFWWAAFAGACIGAYSATVIIHD
jgi:Na+/citrate or Na+/malate symporter